MHLWFSQIADEMMEKGLEFSEVVPHNIDISITPEYLKSVFQAIAKKMYGKKHTSQLTKHELSEVGKVFERWVLGLGIEIRFPSYEELL